VAVKPSFDPLLLSLRDQMEALTRRMEDTARRASKDLYGQAKDADKRVKLDWRWVGTGGREKGGTPLMSDSAPHTRHSPCLMSVLCISTTCESPRRINGH